MPSLRTANSLPIPILMYHQIEVAPPKGAAFRSLYVSPQSFARQMSFLSLLGYRGLSMSALMPYLAGEQTGKVVGITFDDGYLNNLTNALPVLTRHGFSSTCYAVSQQLGKSNEWDREIGIAQTSLMNAAQLRQWRAAGQEVGAHTRHHVRLTDADALTNMEEISLCKSELENMTDSPVQHFCYPYGDYTDDHAAMARAAGFETATTTQRSRCQMDMDVMQLPRVPVVRSTSLPSLWLKLATNYEDRRRS
jgi:peptidoglycan/xylan/chitin deacetylase (PgdA/CDA1 family)